MRQTLLSILCLLFTLSIGAQEKKWLKKVKPAQVSVVAYDRDGNMREAQGVVVAQEGVVVTEYDALKGATRIVVQDQRGHEFPVKEIAGANAMYNVAKLNVEVGKEKVTPIPLAQEGARKADRVLILPYVRTDAKAPCTPDSVAKVETFKDTYSYYTLSQNVSERLAGSPLLNEQGEAIALLQLPAKAGTAAFAIDIRFALDLKVTALDAGNADLKAIPIRKALPADESDAATFIFLTGEKDTLLYEQYADEFLARYPDNTTGHTTKAEFLMARQRYADAERVYAEALQRPTTKHDELHYSLSRTIYEANLNPSYHQHADWDMPKALREAEEAYALNPLPIYTNQEANCLFALKEYDKAAAKFLSLTQTNLRSADIFMYAAHCLSEAGHPQEESLALMDSAMACYPKPYPAAAANHILLRAGALAKAGKAREAVLGYNDFERLAGSGLNASFYYEREQLEIKCRMYPAALNDIEKAIRLSPHEAVLYAEAAALNYRVNDLESATIYARKAIETDPTLADAYRILGVCLTQQGKKEEAREQLLKAIELGDTLAEGILNKAK